MENGTWRREKLALSAAAVEMVARLIDDPHARGRKLALCFSRPSAAAQLIVDRGGAEEGVTRLAGESCDFGRSERAVGGLEGKNQTVGVDGDNQDRKGRGEPRVAGTRRLHPGTKVPLVHVGSKNCTYTMLYYLTVSLGTGRSSSNRKPRNRLSG